MQPTIIDMAELAAVFGGVETIDARYNQRSGTLYEILSNGGLTVWRRRYTGSRSIRPGALR